MKPGNETKPASVARYPFFMPPASSIAFFHFRHILFESPDAVLHPFFEQKAWRVGENIVQRLQKSLSEPESLAKYV